MLTHEQKKFLSGMLGSGIRGEAKGAYGDLLKPYDNQEFMDFYKKSFIDPAQQNLQRNIIPTIKENFMGLDESGSGALNRALAQSATDLSSILGQGMMGQYNQYNANRLSALSGLGGLAGQQTFQPLVSQNQGWLGAAMQGVGTGIGAYAALSSRECKENIRPLPRGLESLKKMQAYQYDYKPDYRPGWGSGKNMVGVMVEDSPPEIVCDVDGKKGIDVYGLVSFLVNCVNELTKKVEALEAKE